MKNYMPDSLGTKRAAFRALHNRGCFVLPNPWDVGGIRRLEKFGFKALASTSAGAAWSLGRNDGELSLDEVLAHLRLLCAATDLPLNADFEAGFAADPEGVAANRRGNAAQAAVINSEPLPSPKFLITNLFILEPQARCIDLGR